MAMPNDVWEEISQDIPSATDPFVQQYLAGRANLIDQEKTTRSDASFRKSLSPIARRACAIVDRIRDHEHRTVWTPDVEEDMAQASEQCVFPGMMFMMAKERMESTRLWKIVRTMPKGCLLHAHMDAMVEFDYLLDELMKLPGMHMASDQPLTTKTPARPPRSTSGTAQRKTPRLRLGRRLLSQHLHPPYQSSRRVPRRRAPWLPQVAQEPLHALPRRQPPATPRHRRHLEKVCQVLRRRRHHHSL